MNKPSSFKDVQEKKVRTVLKEQGMLGKAMSQSFLYYFSALQRIFFQEQKNVML